MNTTQIAAALYQLQQLDLELESIIAQQQTIAVAIQGNATISKLRRAQKAAEQRMYAGLQTQEKAEAALEDLKNRLVAHEKRLYSGIVSNAKELQALQQEVQRMRLQKDNQEEVVLELMGTSESLQEEVHSISQKLLHAEEEWSRENAAMMKRRSELEARRQELLLKREQKISSIEPTLLVRYDAIRRTKQGKAVSKVEQTSCQWCRVILTPSELQRVRISAELQTCSNCGRILYFER